jgi:hypothetical protein
VEKKKESQFNLKIYITTQMKEKDVLTLALYLKMQNSGFSAEYVFIHHMKEQATQNFQCI